MKNQTTLDFFTETDTEKLINYILEGHDPDLPIFLWVDLFCGCGGVTEGYSQAENNFVIACVNHDPDAIKSHHANHPFCIHYTEDIRDFAVVEKINTLVKALRAELIDPIIGLHASLECTHFSKAKGGLAREADSRTLGDHLVNYLVFSPDYITIENVEEFLTWGPVDEDGKVVEELKCTDYNNWVSSFTGVGFNYEYEVLNAADFGEATSRKRYFGCFAFNNLPITFPTPTHVAKKKAHLFPELKTHVPVKGKLNLEDEGVSIFGLNRRGKPYVDATINRVYYGLIKFFLDGYFTVCSYSGRPHQKNRSINEPLRTITTVNNHSIVKPIFLTSYYGASKEGQGVHDIENPAPTITTKDRFALHHLQYAYGNPCYSKIDEPGQTITTSPKHELVTTKWMFDTQFGRIGMSVEKPCVTVVASQHKKPLYLASANNYGDIDHSIPNDEDFPRKALLRQFMREHGIVDIKIRSLELDELKRIQGFPEDYQLVGGKTKAMRFIGNSVCPKQALANADALYNGYLQSIQ